MIKVGNTKINPHGLSKVMVGNTQVWPESTPVNEPLNFTGSGTVGYIITGSLPDIHIQTSTDKVNWTDWDGSEKTVTSDPLYIRNTANTLSISSTEYFYFTMTGSIQANGNVNSMIQNEVLHEYCYYRMFTNCSSLTTPPELPATTLAERCYYGMFDSCSSLTTAPELPATTLVTRCYPYMFDGCSSLVTAPELPATTLAEFCYTGMFQGCLSLVTPPELPATTLARYCYNSMFYGCSSLSINNTGTGTAFFTCPDTTGISYPVRNMFYGTAGPYTLDPVSGSTYYYN